MSGEQEKKYIQAPTLEQNIGALRRDQRSPGVWGFDQNQEYQVLGPRTDHGPQTCRREGRSIRRVVDRQGMQAVAIPNHPNQSESIRFTNGVNGVGER